MDGQDGQDGRAARAVELSVTGVVQGVGFRWHTRQEAERLGVTGWVRNEPDGSVAAHAEGSPEAVAALVSWCGRGPAHAGVAGVDVREVAVTGATSFAVEP